MHRRVSTALVMGLGILTLALAGCGGGSSSSTGPSASGSSGGSSGSSGAVVQGQIRTQTAAADDSAVVVVLDTMLGIGVAEAVSDGIVPDGTVVKLIPTGGGATLTTTTTGGAFHFDNVLPGEYTIQVVGFTTILSGPTTIVVGPGDLADVTGTANKDTIVVTGVHVTALVTDEQGVLQNPTQVGILINLAKAAGVTADTVLALRTQQHMGWGDIAHTLGVHPSVIGQGNQPSQAEIDAFKASHGIGNGKGKGKKA
jgi:hypothetical protein